MQALLLPNKNPVRSMENDMASLCEGGLYPSLRVLGEIPKYEWTRIDFPNLEVTKKPIERSLMFGPNEVTTNRRTWLVGGFNPSEKY